MRTFDLELLQALVMVADKGSLSAAAPYLNRSQSAVSEQIRKLEDFCGMSLFLRSKKGVQLTPSGQRLLQHARQLLAQSDAALLDLQGNLLTGELRLAITDYFRPDSIAATLKQLSLRFPRLRLHVAIRHSAQIEDDLRQGRADIGLGMRVLDAAPSPLQAGSLCLRRESLQWIAAGSLQFAADAPLPLLLLPDSCALHRYLIRTLEAQEVPYAILHSASGIGGLQLALRAGLGVSCMNTSAIPPGVFPCTDPRLPAVTEVEFLLFPPRQGESALAQEVRTLLAQTLA